MYRFHYQKSSEYLVCIHYQAMWLVLASSAFLWLGYQALRQSLPAYSPHHLYILMEFLLVRDFSENYQLAFSINFFRLCLAPLIHRPSFLLRTLTLIFDWMFRLCGMESVIWLSTFLHSRGDLILQRVRCIFIWNMLHYTAASFFFTFGECLFRRRYLLAHGFSIAHYFSLFWYLYPTMALCVINQ